MIDFRYDTGVCVNSGHVGEYIEARFIEPYWINYVFIGKKSGSSSNINERSFEYLNMNTNEWEEIFTIEGFKDDND